MSSRSVDISALIRERRPRLVRNLGLAVLIMAVLSFAAETVGFRGNGVVERLTGLTTVRSLATWTTTIVLFTSGVLCLTAAKLDALRRRYWQLAGATALLLSAEEIVGLHEFNEAVDRGFDPFAEQPDLVGPAVATAVFITAVLAGQRFLRSLPQEVGRRIAVAALLVAVGGIGLQYLGEVIAWSNGVGDSAFVAVHTLEETAELGGFIVFLDAVARYVGSFVRSPDQAPDD